MPLKEMITGCLLGDASIIYDPRGRHPSLSFGHGGIQKDYLFHKYELLKEICTRPPEFKIKTYRGGFANSGLWRFNTSALSWLHEFYALFHQEPKKSKSDAIRPYLAAEGLAYWFMDDGSQSRYIHGQLHCQGFSDTDRHLLALWLIEDHGITVHPSTRASTTHTHFCLNKADYLRLSELIGPFVPPCMAYKIPPEFRDRYEHPKWTIDTPYLKVCAYCGNGYARLLTCGDPECKRQAVNDKNRRNRPKNKEKWNASRRNAQLPTLLCLICKVPFTPRNCRQINCGSQECDAEYRRRQHRINPERR